MPLNALNTRGAIYMRQGKMKLALEEWKKIIQINPKHEKALSARKVFGVSYRSNRKST